MSQSDIFDLQDVDQLSKSIETVFRRLIRFLVGRISLVRLQQMIDFIYVQECERKLSRLDDTNRAPLSKIAIITGLDSRSVRAIQDKIQEDSEQFKESLLKELTPESSVVEAWADKIERSERGEAHRRLTFGHADSGFESIVSETVSARGVTAQTILNRLVATNVVQKDDKAGEVVLVKDRFTPYLADSELNNVNAALTAVSNLLSTLEHNINNPPFRRFFQRQVWSNKVPPLAYDEFRMIVRKLLSNYEENARTRIQEFEELGSEQNQFSLGMGFYYFEDLILDDQLTRTLS